MMLGGLNGWEGEGDGSLGDMARRRAADSLTDLGFRRREGGEEGKKDGWMDGMG
jgi:hypothetical protein